MIEEHIINNIIKVAKQMNTFERSMLKIAIQKLNDGFDNWDNLTEDKQDRLRDGFKRIIELSLAGELL
tara:strand:- start:269 stop:472 length:204 start_codon:yes stop_codon:yes gene_type:complete